MVTHHEKIFTEGIDRAVCTVGGQDHFIRAHANMTIRVGLALAVMMALALGHVVEGRLEQIRSLVKPVPIDDTG